MSCKPLLSPYSEIIGLESLDLNLGKLKQEPLLFHFILKIKKENLYVPNMAEESYNWIYNCPMIFTVRTSNNKVVLALT